MNYEIDNVIRDIKEIMNLKDIPPFFDSFFDWYMENVQDVGRVQNKKKLLSRIAKDFSRLGKTGVYGGIGYNFHPSETYGDLKSFFLGVCPENSSLNDTFSALGEWCEQHSRLKSDEKKYAVILTEKWIPKDYYSYQSTLNISKNTLGIEIVVILIAEHGASEIKLF